MSESSIEQQILNFWNDYKFQTVDHTIGVILDLYDHSDDNIDENEEQDEKISNKEKKWIRWFVPEYQRAYTRTTDRASYFIESIFLWIPSQYIFLATTKKENEFEASNLEIVDGSQRIRTIYHFLSNNFAISNSIKKLTSLHGKKFSELPEQVQSRFKRRSIRAIEIDEMDLDTRKDLFKRINEAVSLAPQEKRKWAFDSKYYHFLTKLAKTWEFPILCPLSDARKDKEKDVEYLLKLFAYTDRFDQYDSQLTKFLDKYMSDMVDLENTTIPITSTETGEDTFDMEIQKQNQLFDEIMLIVKNHLWSFALNNDSSNSISWQRFEAIAVWIGLALKTHKLEALHLQWFKDFVNSKEFIDATTIRWWANNKIYFNKRISAVRDFLIQSSS